MEAAIDMDYFEPNPDYMPSVDYAALLAERPFMLDMALEEAERGGGEIMCHLLYRMGTQPPTPEEEGRVWKRFHEVGSQVMQRERTASAVESGRKGYSWHAGQHMEKARWAAERISEEEFEKRMGFKPPKELKEIRENALGFRRQFMQSLIDKVEKERKTSRTEKKLDKLSKKEFADIWDKIQEAKKQKKKKK